MNYAVCHRTTYLYTEPVAISYNRVHPHPNQLDWQTFSQPKLLITPEPASLHPGKDFFGNPVTFFTVQKSHHQLEVTLKFRAEVQPRVTGSNSELWTNVVSALDQWKAGSSLEASQFRYDSAWVRRSESLRAFAAPSFGPGVSVLEGTKDLCSRIFREFEFDPTATNVATPVEDVLLHRRGVCQDFSHVALGALRSLGLAARYVSGYLLTLPPPGQPRLQGADASHAWLSVWCPRLGWVDLDPTNNMRVSDQHVTLAWGRDYHDVCPLRGVVLGGGTQTVKVAVDVEPLELGPR